jgi:hypothetical protein
MVNCSAIQKSYPSTMWVDLYRPPAREVIRSAIDVPCEIIEDPPLNPGDGETVLGYDLNGQLTYRQNNGRFIDVYK